MEVHDAEGRVLEEFVAGVVDAAQGIVIEGHAGDATVGGERFCLGLDELSGEYSSNGSKLGIPVELFNVSSQLLHAIDVAASFELDRNGVTRRVSGQDVHGSDRCRIFATDQAIAFTECLDVFGQEALKIRLDAVLDETRVDAELVIRFMVLGVNSDEQLVVRFGGLDDPSLDGVVVEFCVVGSFDVQGCRGRHPVEGLIGPTVGMNEHRAVGLDHEQSSGHGKVGFEAAFIIYRTVSYHKSHPPHSTRSQQQGPHSHVPQ